VEGSGQTFEMRERNSAAGAFYLERVAVDALTLTLGELFPSSR